MKKLFFKIFALLTLLGFSTFPYASNLLSHAEQNSSASGLRIAVAADLHYLSTRLAKEGEALAMYEKATGRGVRDLHQVLHQVLGDLVKEDIDVLLIPGDLTNHGERQSHLDLRDILLPLHEKGIRLFVVPGNHDVNIPNAMAYAGAKTTPTEGVSKEEFAEIYAPFGYAHALECDEASLSYLAALNDSVWLLAFDTNQYDENTRTSVTAGRIRPETMEWAISQLDRAKEMGITVLGMMHHGLVEHLPYQSDLFSAYLVEEWERDADRLANAGLKVVFTGHFHSNDVSKRVSPTGQVIHDVETASLAQYPFAYRIMDLQSGALAIETRFVTSVPNNPNLEEDYRERMMNMSRRIAMGRLKSLGIPMPDETLEVLTDVVARMSVMHAKGDEELDEEMKEAIRGFAALLGGEADFDAFEFDFPPRDNQLVIRLD